MKCHYNRLLVIVRNEIWLGEVVFYCKRVFIRVCHSFHLLIHCLLVLLVCFVLLVDVLIDLRLTPVLVPPGDVLLGQYFILEFNRLNLN